MGFPRGGSCPTTDGELLAWEVVEVDAEGGGCGRCDAEGFVDASPGNPGEGAVADEEGDEGALVSGDAGVDKEVLEFDGAAESEGAIAITGLPAPQFEGGEVVWVDG